MIYSCDHAFKKDLRNVLILPRNWLHIKVNFDCGSQIIFLFLFLFLCLSKVASYTISNVLIKMCFSVHRRACPLKSPFKDNLHGLWRCFTNLRESLFMMSTYANYILSVSIYLSEYCEHVHRFPVPNFDTVSSNNCTKVFVIKY